VDAIVYEYTAANEICHLIGRVESNANVIYREIYFYIRCTMLSVDEEKALSPGWFWKDKYSQNNWRRQSGFMRILSAIVLYTLGVLPLTVCHSKTLVAYLRAKFQACRGALTSRVKQL
jgi:hypothetical protein